MKESIQRAFGYLQGNKVKLGIASWLRTNIPHYPAEGPFASIPRKSKKPSVPRRHYPQLRRHVPSSHSLRRLGPGLVAPPSLDTWSKLTYAPQNARRVSLATVT